MNILDAIKKRKSIRNYKKLTLTDSDRNSIIELLEKSGRGPFGNKARFQFIEKPIVKQQEKVKLGTYGFINNAQYFVGGAIEKFEFSEVDYGYLLELIILELTKLGMGTCWLGGTYNPNDYRKILNLDEKEIIPAVTPVGYPADKKSLRERLGLKLTDGNIRKDFGLMFFDNGLNIAMEYNADDVYSVALEMVRIAPSAVNKQPWRVIKKDNKFHFFIERSGMMNVKKTVDLQKVDIGIALAHFELTLKHYNQKGIWHIKNPDICNLEYIITWIPD